VLHFVIHFNQDIQRIHGWTVEDGERAGVSRVKGKDDVSAYVTFNAKKDVPVMAQIGLSLVDIEGAQKNLDHELTPYGWDFDAVVRDAQEEWRALLGRVEVEDPSEVNKKKFYTNLYRCYAQKQTWTDVDGRYVDPFEKVQQLPPGAEMYGGDSFWNTFWNHNAVHALISPHITENWVETQLELFDKTGWTQVGPTGLEHTGVMDVTHEIVLMISAWQKGIWKGDPETLYKAVRKVVTVEGGYMRGTGLAGNHFLNTYLEKGYVPYKRFRTDIALNYAFDFYCVAQLAKALGKEDDYMDFMEKSEYWRNLWHPDLKYIVPRDKQGQWHPDFDPFSGFSFTEGNAWQYSWYVPHNIHGLMVAMGGPEAFATRLEEGFERSVKHRFAAHAFDRAREDAVEYYINHGNQGNMQAAYLFNYAGKPHLTQKYSRAIMDRFYGSTPYHGWEGDEDEGQMGGWFVMSALGMFEMVGGVNPEPIVDLSSPLFEKVTIHLDPAYHPGKTLVIEAAGNSSDNIYIQSATFNGKPIKHPWIPFKDLVKGGTLRYEMGSSPGEVWTNSAPEN
jgi:predicted alpha-1,2-mannosidase